MKEQIIEKWSTLKEVQEYLGVGRDTILQWIAKRNMPAYKVCLYFISDWEWKVRHGLRHFHRGVP